MIARRVLLTATTLAAILGYRLGRPTLLEGTPMSSVVYDRHGELLRLALAADDRYRLPADVAELAPALVATTLLYEDRWFFWHPGVNPWALCKAALQTALGGPRRGASTLTMQLARLRFGIDSHTVHGKLAQILRALQLELYYSKGEILEAYLTLAPYGGNIEGAAAASRIYFDKDAKTLSLAEAMALAVMPQRPAARAPTADGLEPLAMASARQRLARAYLEAHPDVDAPAAGVGTPLVLRRRSELPFLAPHVAVRFARSGKIVTTLDLELQRLLERRVRDFVARTQANGIDNVAALLVDHRSMDVLAALGSADFANTSILGQVDGTRAKRSPGSTLKPFIYALALEQGLIHPNTLLKDAPMRFGAYNPENFDGEFEGPLSATEALMHSRNVPAVYLETELRRRGGNDGGLYGLLARAGIQGLEPPKHYGLALVLGGLEVTMTELVGLYAALARGGTAAPLRYTFEAAPSAGAQLLSAEAAALTLEMLKSDDRDLGSGTRVRDELPIAWKTGTSYGFRDAWTVGVVGPFVLAVWVGNFDSRGNPAFVGRRAAAPLFFEIIESLRPRLQAEPAGPPPAVSTVQVCAVSGQFPNAHCPKTHATQFIAGVSPITTCDVHREVRLDPATGLRACPGELDGTRARIFEFWPSDLHRLFEQAGLPRVRPPAYASRCGLANRAELGRAPTITTPQPQVTYHVRANNDAHDRIPLAATADADVATLHWFVDDRFLGVTTRGEPLLWTTQPGNYIVRVVDDSGRSDAQPVRVALVE